MNKRPPLVYYAKNNDYIDFGEMTLYRFGGEEPRYEVTVENPYGRGQLKLTEKDIRRLFSCLEEEFKNPTVQVAPVPFPPLCDHIDEVCDC